MARSSSSAARPAPAPATALRASSASRTPASTTRSKLAIGYASLSAVGDTVKTLTVEGVECSEATVLDGTYKVQRPFNFITNDAAELSDAAKAFIDFAVSADAAELIRLAGAVPLVDAE